MVKGPVIVPTFPRKKVNRPKNKPMVWRYKRDRRRGGRRRTQQPENRVPLQPQQPTQQQMGPPAGQRPMGTFTVQQPEPQVVQVPPINQPVLQEMPQMWKIIIVIILAILAMIFLYRVILSLGISIPSGGGGGSCVCHCEDGSGRVCTSNTQCADYASIPGTRVPGICGCPVGC